MRPQPIPSRTENPKREQMAEVDILENIDPHTSQTFLWTTLNIQIVDPLAGLDYIRLLHQAGISGELHIFEFVQHGLGRADAVSAKVSQDINPLIAQ